MESERDAIPNPFRGRLLSFHGGAGFNLYTGNVGASRLGGQWRIGGSFHIIPEVTISVSGTSAKLAYTRSIDSRAPDVYRYQFGSDIVVDRSTPLTAFDLVVMANLLPWRTISPFFSAGAGIVSYYPDDYADDLVRYRPRSENLTAAYATAGAGIEFQLSNSFSLLLDTRYCLTFSQELDAYDPQQIAAQMSSPPSSVPQSANDGFVSMIAGVRWYPFYSPDYDADMLTNIAEDSIGTNPHDPDTDSDRLADGEEVLVYHTSPFRSDTDNDGLGDYTEIIVSHTNPLSPDSDTDGLSDAEEVKRYKTDPNKADTDDDMLTDFEEIMFYSTDPLNPDTDCDQLLDGLEVKTYQTDPLKPDTDSDGLGDFTEIFTYKTDPRRTDTDSDNVTDFEEIRYYNTNPLVTDTDGDGLSDAYELLTIGTNPLRQDTDRDNIPDNVDPNPLVPEGYAGGQRGNVPFDKPRLDTTTFAGQRTLLVNINFDFAKYNIRPEYFSLLESYVSIFLQLSRTSIEIRGHTDFEGTEQFNQMLSENRAKAVRDFLVRRGISLSRIKITGYGEQYPLAQCETEECKALNRRVEFILEDTSTNGSQHRTTK